MDTQTGSDTEFNETVITDVDSISDVDIINAFDNDDLTVRTQIGKKNQSFKVRRMIEHRLEQMQLKEQIDTWGFEDQPDIDLEH